MSTDTQFKKDVQNRKRNYEEKKVELITRLCSESPKTIDKRKIISKNEMLK